MTDKISPAGKLPEFVEEWIAENETELRVRDKYGDTHDIVVAVDVYDLRAFLWQYVLCSPEVSAYLCVEKDGGNVDAAVTEHQQDVYRRCGRELIPLHAPATKEPK